MSSLSVRLNISDFITGVDQVNKYFPAAIARAVSRTATSARAAMTQAIAADTGIPAATIRDQIKITLSGESAELTVQGRRIPLIDFKASGPEPSHGRGRGVSYRLPTGRGRVADAFIATMPGGHRGVFKRRGNARLPIQELFGPSLPHVFAKYLPVGQERARQALVTNLQSEIAFALTR